MRKILLWLHILLAIVFLLLMEFVDDEWIVDGMSKFIIVFALAARMYHDC